MGSIAKTTQKKKAMLACKIYSLILDLYFYSDQRYSSSINSSSSILDHNNINDAITTTAVHYYIIIHSSLPATTTTHTMSIHTTRPFYLLYIDIYIIYIMNTNK